MANKYTKESLELAAKHSNSFADMARFFGISPHGGSQHHIKKRTEFFAVSTEHFDSRAWSKGKVFTNRRKAPEEILIRRESGRNREHGYLLRRALLELGIEEKCAICGLSPEWEGKHIRLVVDHVDGDILNCLKENLRFLCPNCDSQTPTYMGRNRKDFRESRQIRLAAPVC